MSALRERERPPVMRPCRVRSLANFLRSALMTVAVMYLLIIAWTFVARTCTSLTRSPDAHTHTHSHTETRAQAEVQTYNLSLSLSLASVSFAVLSVKVCAENCWSCLTLLSRFPLDRRLPPTPAASLAWPLSCLSFSLFSLSPSHCGCSLLRCSSLCRPTLFVVVCCCRRCARALQAIFDWHSLSFFIFLSPCLSLCRLAPTIHPPHTHTHTRNRALHGKERTCVCVIQHEAWSQESAAAAFLVVFSLA